MERSQNNVVHLHQRDLMGALERLNLITGLQFSRWPESLSPAAQQDPAPAADFASDAPFRQLG
ncbi:hypothetical protein [Pseudomonas schmalbachii]|uniref:Uncharacterized protein n=1 Tax=Pseudomonas schmalbachii TaxID=2816993 RepID=A0ABS3TUD3_9PSED|nr:hypothetical protein [Pseudomonas schmalbachii]MBO3277270.1 hypothetical protein [Pseudomonas schmalbachii]